MATDDTSNWIDAAASSLGLALAPEWKPNVIAFFEVARTMASLVEATGAAASCEAAPTFTPQSTE